MRSHSKQQEVHELMFGLSTPVSGPGILVDVRWSNLLISIKGWKQIPIFCIEFVHFHGENTPVMVNVSLQTLHHQC